MGDADKVNKYDGLQWEEEIPLHADKNTLKYLGEALQKNDELKEFMSHDIQLSIDISKKKDLIKQNDSDEQIRKNKVVVSNKGKFIENNNLGTPNQKFFKLQKLKKNCTHDNYFKQEYLNDRQYDQQERTLNETNFSRYSLLNNKSTVFDKQKIQNQSDQNIHCIIDDDNHLMIKDYQNLNKSQTDNNIFSTQVQQEQMNNISKIKQEDQFLNTTVEADKQVMQNEAAIEFKRKVNQIVSQNNKEFILQFTRIKNQSKSKQSEIYQKILEFYQQKQKIAASEIQHFQDIYNKNKNNSFYINNNKQNLNKISQNDKSEDTQYQKINNIQESKAIRSSKSVQPQINNPTENQLNLQEDSLQSRKRNISLIQSSISKQQEELEEQEVQNYLLMIGQDINNSHMNKTYNFNQGQFQSSNKFQCLENSYKQLNLNEEILQDQDQIIQINYDQLLNQRLKRKILSTSRIHRDQIINKSSFQNLSNSFIQDFQGQISNENRGIGQAHDTQTIFCSRAKLSSRTPVKINRLQVVDSFKKTDIPQIIQKIQIKSSPKAEKTKNMMYKDADTSLFYDNSQQNGKLIDGIKRYHIKQQNNNYTINKIMKQKQLANILQESPNKSDLYQKTLQMNGIQSSSQHRQKLYNKQLNQIVQNKQMSPNQSIQRGYVQNEGYLLNKDKQINQNTQYQKYKNQNSFDYSILDQIQINQDLIKQNYQLNNNNKMSSFMRNKYTHKEEVNISSLSSKIFNQIKERIFMV